MVPSGPITAGTNKQPPVITIPFRSLRAELEQLQGQVRTEMHANRCLFGPGHPAGASQAPAEHGSAE